MSDCVVFLYVYCCLSCHVYHFFFFFFFNDTATTEIYTLSLHDALPIWSTGFIALPRTAGRLPCQRLRPAFPTVMFWWSTLRSEEHTSELQSRRESRMPSSA